MPLCAWFTLKQHSPPDRRRARGKVRAIVGDYTILATFIRQTAVITWANMRLRWQRRHAYLSSVQKEKKKNRRKKLKKRSTLLFPILPFYRSHLRRLVSSDVTASDRVSFF